MEQTIEEAIQDHRLPENFVDTVEQWYRPLAQKIAENKKGNGKTLVVGVQGCQGSGKSTLSHFLKILLKQQEQQMNWIML